MAKTPGVLLFASGACALLAEVLWPRALAPALGGTARAEAIILAAIFVGLALGGALGARLGANAGGRRALWRRWAACEAGGAAATLLPLVAIGPLLERPALAPLVALLLVGPAAAAGAAWPLALALADARGRAAATLHAVATAGGLAGAAGGALLVAEHLGARAGLVLAAIGAGLVAVAALALARRAGPGGVAAAAAAPLEAGSASPWPWIVGIASGLIVLGSEALHARLLAARLPHSGYAFAAVVVAWLGAMAIGGVIGGRIARGGVIGLGRLLVVAAALLALGPHAAGWRAPLTDEGFTLVELALVVLPGALAAGSVFPCAAALCATSSPSALGRLAGWNAVAALAGALGATRLLLPALGPGGALAAVAALAGALGLACAARAGARRGELGLAALVLAGLTLSAPARAPLVLAPGERVLDVRDGPAASVVVVEDSRTGERRLVADGRYTLGDSASRAVARRLALLPWALRPRPARALLVGLATGITAGGACDAAATHGGAVVAAELLPEAALLREHFRAWQADSGLAPEVVVDDGRLVLARDRDGFDLVVVDLVVPWHPGTGLLWGVEPLERARARLRPGGAFALWLPLHQTSPEGLVRVLASVVAAFPDARAVAGSLDPGRPLLLVMSGAAGAPAVELERARLAAAGVLDPLLAAPGAIAALDLGPIAPALSRVADVLGVTRRDPVREDDLRLELEGARARARGEAVTGDRFRAVVAVFDALAPASPEPATLAVRAAWRGDPVGIGRVHLLAARALEGEDRARALLTGARALRSGAPDEALAAALALTPERAAGAAWSAVAVEGAQVALSRRDPAAALRLLERLVDPPVSALVLAAVAEDAAGRRDAARERLAAARAKDPEGARAAVSSMGLAAWAAALDGR